MSDNNPYGIEVEDCKRHKIIIGKERGYLTVGSTFVSVTLPDENKQEVQKAREAADVICNKLTEIMGGSHS
jgi:hypothetical protein